MDASDNLCFLKCLIWPLRLLSATTAANSVWHLNGVRCAHTFSLETAIPSRNSNHFTKIVVGYKYNFCPLVFFRSAVLQMRNLNESLYGKQHVDLRDRHEESTPEPGDYKILLWLFMIFMIGTVLTQWNTHGIDEKY